MVRDQKLKEIMGKLILEEIIEATRGRILYGKQREFTALSIDSRTIKKGELFVALKGPNFDGHEFIPDALKDGFGAIVNSPPAEPIKGKTIIYVKNTIDALHDIARYLRLKIDVPVIGVTGTNGKTTTKELIASIFCEKHKVLSTFGNMNNHVGMPLSISRVNGDESVMVLEMGSNAQGDIKQLCNIAYPDFAVITNVGLAHLEGFGSLEMVRKTDLEILEYVKVACVNADDHFLIEGLREFSGKIITYGTDKSANVRAEDIVLKDNQSSFRLCFSSGGQIEINLGIAGKFNIYNALAASSIAGEFGLNLMDIKKGVESFKGVPMRLEIKELFGSLVICDVYNANPASMDEAIRELVRLKRQRTIAVLGDMLELGPYAVEAHKKLISLISELNIDVLIAVGPEMKKASSEFTGICYKADDSVSARSILLSICRDGDTILVKGSRSMHMERVLNNSPMKEEKHAI
jgi:UDP-N-acetylmuramoyl-tripeptide--D-alanyl-D-alanine ligase